LRAIMTGQCNRCADRRVCYGLAHEGASRWMKLKGAVRIMRELMVPVPLGDLRNVVDIVGHRR
jgi:hypothetical protein